MPPRSRNRNRATTTTAPAHASTSSLLTFDVNDLIAPPEAVPIQTFVDRASGDGRTFVRETVRLNPPSPLKRARLGRTSLDDAPDASFPSNVTLSAEEFWDAERYSMPQNEDDTLDLPAPPPPRRPVNPKRFLPAVRFCFIKNASTR
jgi:hypothetical protein